MNREESRNDLGILKIHKNAIASISLIAANEIEGVKSVGRGTVNGILEFFGRKFSSIKVDISKSDEVRVEVPLVIKYGYNIPEVANSVQENVRAALERMSNLSIKEVNVNVQAIERG